MVKRSFGSAFASRSGATALWPRLLRALVLAIALPLASAGALPVWAQLVGVEGPHVCHCSTEQHDCVCPRCHTDPDAAMFLSTESLKGRCGDDEIAFGGKAFIAVLAPMTVLVPVVGEPLSLPIAIAPASLPKSPPPKPPPRLFS